MKDNNSEVYKTFSGGNLDIRYAMIENGQDCHPIYLLIKQAIIRALKSNAGQKRSTGFQETHRGI